MPWYGRRSRSLARDLYWGENDKETYQCPDCGRSDELLLDTFDVHHKNGEMLDNRIENLIGLCRVCHNLREEKKPSLKRIRHLRTQHKVRIDAERDDASERNRTKEHADKRLQKTITASMVFAEGVEAYADRESEAEPTPRGEPAAEYGTEPKSDKGLEEEWAELEEEFGDSDVDQEQSREEAWAELEEMFGDTGDDSEQDEGGDEDPWKHLSYTGDRETTDE